MPLFEISFEDHTEMWEAGEKTDCAEKLGEVYKIKRGNEYTSETTNIYWVTLERPNLPEAFTDGHRLIQEARIQHDIKDS
ncbi:MAG: hypothetical protein ACLQMS_16755 [Desulfomonilaceae bacterium]